MIEGVGVVVEVTGAELPPDAGSNLHELYFAVIVAIIESSTEVCVCKEEMEEDEKKWM